MPRIDPHPRYDRLKQTLKSTCSKHVENWQRPTFRCVEPKWARPEYLISGHGTKLNGGRWMLQGVANAVYVSSTEAIALKEAKHNFSRYGIKPRSKPRVLVELEVKASGIVSLSSLLTDLSWPSLDELLEEDWESVNDQGTESLSQAFGRIIWELNFEGLRVPSSRDRRGSNLLWFPQNLCSSSFVRIQGESELKRWIVK